MCWCPSVCFCEPCFCRMSCQAKDGSVWNSVWCRILGKVGESQWYVMQILTLRVSKPGGEQGKGRRSFFLEVLSFWVECLVFWKSLRDVICHFCSMNWLAVFTGSFPASDWWWYCDHWHSVWQRVLPSSPCSFSTVCQILAEFSCYSSRMNKMLSQPLLLEEDDTVYCMSKILWNELLSTKIKVLFNTGTGTLCYRSLFFKM